LIISVDTALRPLLFRGISPHIVVAGDPQEANFDHFRMIPSEKTRNIFLVADLRVSPLVFDFWQGKIFICDFGSEIMRWITRFSGEIGRLSVWGSVSTVAVSLAYEIGSDPIILLGQDLAYTGGRRYASYTWVDEMGINLVNPEGEGLSMEKDLWDREVWTARNMVSYRDWMAQFFKKVRGSFINSTEGGILKDNLAVMNFVEVANRVLSEPFDAFSILESKWIPFRKRSKFKENLLRELKLLKKKVEEVRSFCEEALSLFKESYDKIVEDIRGMEEKLKMMWRDYPFLGEGFLSYIVSFNRSIERSRMGSQGDYLDRERDAYLFLFAGIRDRALRYEEVIETSMRMLGGEGS